MKVRICHHDSQGMANDAVCLQQVVAKRYPDAKIEVVHYPELSLHYPPSVTIPIVDVQFFIEHVHPVYVRASTQNIFIPNPEWMLRVDAQHAQSDVITKIVAKTQSGYRALQAEYGAKVCFWGWTSIDRLDETVWKTFDECIHVKGCSAFKNSQMVVDLWVQHPEWPLLHVIVYGNTDQNGYLELNREFIQVADNIKLYQRKLDETELTRLMNRCGIHICPSQMEGFGHYINEARSCRSYVIATDGEPMNELVSEDLGSLIEVKESTNQSIAKRYVVEPNQLEKTLLQTFAKSHDELIAKADAARSKYVADTISFEENVII